MLPNDRYVFLHMAYVLTQLTMFNLIEKFLPLLFENIKLLKERFAVITLLAVSKEHIFVQEAFWIFKAVNVVRNDLGGSLTTV